MRRRKRKRNRHGLVKEMVIAGRWFREYWPVVFIILMAVASAVAYYYWFIGTMSSHP